MHAVKTKKTNKQRVTRQSTVMEKESVWEGIIAKNVIITSSDGQKTYKSTFKNIK